MQNNTFLGLFVGHKIVTLSEIDSTNNFLKQTLSKSTPFSEGTVIMAENQTAGRGQMQNVWVSEPGKNLTFSVLLMPRFLAIPKQFELNKAISLALCDVLTKYFGTSARIKWPNDSYIGNQKIAGMLIENMVQASQIRHAIIGIGLNVNQTDFPPSLQNVTSFKKILHTDYDLHILLAEICKAIEVRYLQLKAGKLAELHADYVDKLYRVNEWHQFKIDGQIQPGKIYGVSPEGYLQVETEHGFRQFGLKEIEFIAT